MKISSKNVVTDTQSGLQKTLGPFTIWGLGVGYVISGMYFGWNLGLPLAGPYGFLGLILMVSLLYSAFVLCYAELACAMPKAGGAFVYAQRAFGSRLGFLAGVAQLVEFIFAPPAIAAAIGAYFSLFFPQFTPLVIATVAYFLFTAMNIYGVRLSAVFELFITVFAVGELLIFMGFTAPSFSIQAFAKNSEGFTWSGILQAIPFAIWFYLAIEGIANVAEESKNPRKDIHRGFLSVMGTLFVLAIGVFFCAVGVAGWEAIVGSDSPLPLALSHVVGEGSLFYHMLIAIGLFGLVASFHGIILASGRAMLEMGRSGFAPAFLGRTHPRRHTPAWALLVNMSMGLIALWTGHTGEIIMLSVMGALTLYVISMLAFLKLRRDEPHLTRPFMAPFFPYAPWIALILSGGCLISVCVFNWQLMLIFVVLLSGAILINCSRTVIL